MAAVPATSVAGDLYERHSGRVLAYCLRRLGRRDEAEDATQSTFERAFQGLRRGITPECETAWLLGIARNVCLARIDTRVRRRRVEEMCDPVQLERSAVAPGNRREELLGLEEALRRLPDQQRRAVLLRDWRGLSYHEIAAELGVSHAAVETLLFRGRNALADHLRESPAATRRRLASLGNAGSLFTWAKASFGGASAIAKLAAAVGAVAITGAGVTAGRAVLAPDSSPPAGATATRVAPERASGAALPPTAPVAAPHRGREATDPVRPDGRAERTPPFMDTASLGDTPGPGGDPVPAVARDDAPTGVAAAPGPTAGPAEAAPAGAGATVGPAAGLVEETAPTLAPVTEAVAATVESLPAPPVAVETPPLVEGAAAVADEVLATATAAATDPPLPSAPVAVEPPALVP